MPGVYRVKFEQTVFRCSSKNTIKIYKNNKTRNRNRSNNEVTRILGEFKKTLEFFNNVKRSKNSRGMIKSTENYP